MRQRIRSLACKIKKARKPVTTVTPETPGIPRAVVLTVSFVVSPETGFLSPSPARCAKHRRRLGTSIGVSGRHDFAVRIQRIRLVRCLRPLHPATQRP